ncbi:Aquaporin NIP1-1 [Hibiscus syriacus]|uniref:Aquaporin NIP1-1 n=1 Tax=Hibiscus syriacus TaxID=106335 RepID=A0A6A3BGE8_HIBSY|nr:Aquaporin NIP1-1 [Hibiscus syriacus]
MAEISESNAVSVLNFNDEPNDQNPPPSSAITKDSHMFFSTPFIQKLLAEVLGTYFLIFAGCASVVVNVNNDKVVSLPGISMVWGLAVTVLVYSLGHISGAHFNPAVTIAFATCKRFPLKQVPFYIVAQAIGSTMAAVTLRLLFSCLHDVFAGTSPQGSGLQAFVIEFITTFYLILENSRDLPLAPSWCLTCCLLDNWSIDEPGKELGACNCVEPIQGNMDISYIANRWGSVRCLGL